MRRQREAGRRSFAAVLDCGHGADAAVGAFTAYGIDGAAGISLAGERFGSPVMFLVSAETFCSPFGPPLVKALGTLADTISVPCVVELDHVRTIEAVRAGFEAGVGAVMADGSIMPLRQNEAFVREAVMIARDHGGGIEAELGRVEGDEDVSHGAIAGLLTDPREAEAFVEATGVDCLAISVGNVHGAYRGEPKIDMKRIAKIAASTGVPLSLHGASGLPGAVLREAIGCGIRKVNFNTELRVEYFRTLLAHAREYSEGVRLQQLAARISENIATVVEEKLAILGGR